MKICPNCDFENFDNLQNCDGCGQSIQIIRPEFFTITDFIKKNSEIYAVIGIFIVLFQFFFSSQDPNVKIVSLFPLFMSLYLMFSLIIKGDRIVKSQSNENSINRYFNTNSFEFWIFLSINASLILGLVWSTGNQYLLSICYLGGIALILAIFGRRISNERVLTTGLIWLNLFGIFFLEVGWLVFQFLSPVIKNPTDPNLFYWTLMIPLFILFFGLGIFSANMFIGIWMILAGREHNIVNQVPYTWTSFCDELSQYFQTFQSDVRMTTLLGLNILLGIGILSIFFSPS